MSTENSREGWSSVRLGDAVIRTSKRCTPDLSDSVRWVGADHIDEGDLAVRRWSTTDDPMFPPTFCFGVPSGSVLLHSRNPKKVAILPFDAITGEKLFCLSPADKATLDSRFLAYQLQSDHFHEFVGRWLSGSVNKFLNWTALERYEFALPPIDEQREIVEVLLQVTSLQEKVSRIDSETVLHSVVARYLTVSNSQLRLGQVVDRIENRYTGRRDANYPAVLLEDMDMSQRLQVQYGAMSRVSGPLIEFQKGDILFGKLRPNLRKIAIATFDGVCGSEVVVLRCKNEYPAAAVLAIMTSTAFFLESSRYFKGTKMPRVNPSDLLACEVPDLASEWTQLGELSANCFKFISTSREHKKRVSILAGGIREKLLGGRTLVH